MAENVYTGSGLVKQQDDNCCGANTGCIVPRIYDPEKIKAECIFVEKVYDSVVLKDEFDQVATFTLKRKVKPNFKIKSVTVTCTTKPKGDSSGTTITILTNSINGMPVPTPTPTGPGGVEQIPLDFIDTSECDALDRGTPIILDETLIITGEVLITITLTLIRPNGKELVITESVAVTIDDIEKRKFAKLCMPSTCAAMKPSLAEFCGILCDFILPLGLNSITIDEQGNITVNGIVVLCVTCEKKVKVPVQLCVLSTGFCEYPEQGGLCVEYPNLFPDQVNVQIIEKDS
ncbi:hypothetical protein SAMN02745883_00514 [Caminicella sporogenes DSM 14501]|uniref:Uncharacterized protein n=1 Tax=Caminicella sporogenes DSM 14501 TaxID=1121266 RepID=A0A1M6MF69_9FIRM|nr:hypothetical protein [Caminicella sporogenes]RKD27577.1 hypothetical protein BET04_00465 [Caminicella sporogenes]SHJ81996.1 hypothetical protein SAMN02745883_00514 [Caminicella sporogenes DSM 14501]